MEASPGCTGRPTTIAKISDVALIPESGSGLIAVGAAGVTFLGGARRGTLFHA